MCIISLSTLILDIQSSFRFGRLIVWRLFLSLLFQLARMQKLDEKNREYCSDYKAEGCGETPAFVIGKFCVRVKGMEKVFGAYGM